MVDPGGSFAVARTAARAPLPSFASSHSSGVNRGKRTFADAAWFGC